MKEKAMPASMGLKAYGTELEQQDNKLLH